MLHIYFLLADYITMTSTEFDKVENNAVNFQESIPKIIHQIWLQGKNQIPNKYIPYINTIHQYHPKQTWQYILWDDIMIIQLLRQNKVWIDTYYKLTYLHQKVDYARYIILFIYGGIYIDMDVIMIKPLDSLLYKLQDYDLVVSKINMNLFDNIINCGRNICINNGIIMAKPGALILAQIIDYINQHPNCSGFIKFNCINNTTGPKVFTRIILDHLNNKIKILDSEYLEPQVFGTGRITNNTYAIHKHDGTWLSSWLRQLASFYVRNKIIIMLILIMLIVMFIICFIHRKK
jgi:inositol phosphorylceramide mannosyltransferase catalytic subunit